MGSQFGVADRMLEVPMAEILLQGAGIDAFVGQIKATRMPQHMRMDGEGEAGRTASLGNDMVDRPRREWRPALGDKHIGHLRIRVLELAEGPEFRAPEGMERWQTVFDPPDMQQRRFQIQHIPF